MKRYILLLLFLLTCSFVKAQDEIDTSWKRGVFINVNFSQVSLSNWAAGGENSISLAAITNLFLNYRTEKRSWENSLDLAYGLTKSGDEGVRKFDDKIEFISKYGQKATGKLFYAALLSFKSQFQPGYNYYPDDSTVLLSRFFSPAIVLVSVGLDWKPTDYFSLYFSPATGKFTFVNDQDLADLGAYGVEPGENSRIEFGAYLSAKFKKELLQNVSLESKLDLFENYTDEDASNKKNIDVNWTVLVNMKINKFLAASLSTELIYDHNTPVPLYSKDADGNRFQSGAGPRTQFKEVLAVGLSVKF